MLNLSLKVLKIPTGGILPLEVVSAKLVVATIIVGLKIYARRRYPQLSRYFAFASHRRSSIIAFSDFEPFEQVCFQSCMLQQLFMKVQRCHCCSFWN